MKTRFSVQASFKNLDLDNLKDLLATILDKEYYDELQGDKVKITTEDYE